jgi:hypothetical protein
MRKWFLRVSVGLLLLLLMVGSLIPTVGQGRALPEACQELAFSTEQSFITRGPEPPDGDPLISDGDLLGQDCVLCARNAELLRRFDVTVDLGLDAVDVLNAENFLVAFSTELDSPHGDQFTAGDLLSTTGMVIPNRALTDQFNVRYDLGLDAILVVGEPRAILAFGNEAQGISREAWLEAPERLRDMLRQYEVDIWFSTEEGYMSEDQPLFLDGDLLSARDGVIVAANENLLPGGVPAGIPNRGVDFGLDGASGPRDMNREDLFALRFSTEILYKRKPGFTDGDILGYQDGVLMSNENLVRCFEPQARFLGLDALSGSVKAERNLLYLPWILKQYGRR